MLTGHYARHVRAARRHYSACHDALLASVRTHWGDHVVLGPCDTGLHVVAHLPRNLDDTAIAATVHEHPLRVTPLSRYYARQPRRGLLVGFGAGSSTAVTELVEALAPALRRPVQRQRRR